MSESSSGSDECDRSQGQRVLAIVDDREPSDEKYAREFAEFEEHSRRTTCKRMLQSRRMFWQTQVAAVVRTASRWDDNDGVKSTTRSSEAAAPTAG